LHPDESCRDLLNDRQRAREIGGTNREPIHRRAAERRQVDERLRRLGRDPPSGLPHGHALARAHVRASEHKRLRLLQGE